jgi:putative peptidoglycan lipid II flippase
MGLVVVPAAVVLTVLARPIVDALLARGDFTAHSAGLTAETLAAFGVGLFFFSAYLFTMRGFYAMQDTRTPFLLNCLENAINIALALALYPVWGVQGLAASWSVAYGVSAVVAIVVMRRRLRRLEGRRMLESLARVVLASAVLGASSWLVATAIGYGSANRALLATVAALAVGGGLFLLVLRLLDAEELSGLRAALRRRPLPAV